ncbi:MAG: 4Fe-4S binding protein [Candidatus Bathyarchaeia archaeon]
MVRYLAIVDANKCVGCQLCMLACTSRFGYAGLNKSAIRVKSSGGFERGFAVIVCRQCKDPPCARVCPVDALTVKESGGVTLNPNACIGCGRCFEVCDIGAVMWDTERMKPIICVACGYCVNFCPHGVLALREAKPNEKLG